MTHNIEQTITNTNKNKPETLHVALMYIYDGTICLLFFLGERKNVADR